MTSYKVFIHLARWLTLLVLRELSKESINPKNQGVDSVRGIDVEYMMLEIRFSFDKNILFSGILTYFQLLIV